MLYTVKEVSEYLDVCELTVRTWIKQGKLKAVKLSRHDGYRIPIESIFDFCRKTKYGAAAIVTDDEGGTELSDILDIIERRKMKLIKELERLCKIEAEVKVLEC